MSIQTKNENIGNLVLYDISYFIKKYTRFMSKNIYISQNLHQLFFDQYHYLYETLDKEKLLYINHPEYQKVIAFQKNKDSLLKLHNTKYLKRESLKYQDFFKELYSEDIIDLNKKNAILSLEQEMLFITSKNQIYFIVGKIKYLIEILNYQEEKIAVITSNSDLLENLKKELEKKNIHKVVLLEIESYKIKFLQKEEILLEEKTKYQIIKDILIQKIYPDKKKFTKVYQAFSKAIYLNKDFKEFETFSDYHSYMYKRKYLSSNLSLKKYNEEEIKKRRNYLRTICNECVNTKEEVDIANFFYLNNIPYTYSASNSSFFLYPEDKQFTIYYQNHVQTKKIQEQPNTLILYQKDLLKKNALEVLVYELIKRRYPMEKRGEEEVYDQLKETTKDSYFSNFISNHLLPMIEYQKKDKNFKKTTLSKEQIESFQMIYSYYQKELNESSYIEEEELYQRVEASFHKKKYQYIILWNQLGLTPQSPYLRLLEEYPEPPFIKENIKLSLEHKKYLTEHKKLPVLHAFTNLKEIQNLSNQFLKLNLKDINQNLATNTKQVLICPYDDSNRLLISKKLAQTTFQILQKNQSKSLLLGFRSLKDINLIIDRTTFSKIEKNILITQEKQTIEAKEIYNIKKLVEILILPYLVPDPYHEDLLDQYFEHKMKIMLYIALTKCKKELYLLCPNSKLEEVKENLQGLKNITILKNV